MLPTGLKGLFVAVMLCFLITTQDTYLHSWGTIFVQDVVLPLRKKAFTPKQHVWLLRISIIFVAIFAFFFSLLYKQTDFILMFMAITGAVVSGTGAMLIGGLYWRRGTTAGAISALTVGWLIPVILLVVEQIVIRMENVPAGDRSMLLQAMIWLAEQNKQYV
jgi:SSS family solute:Na+ symporter